MDRGIWAIWYGLPEEGREEYLEWYHKVHIPEILARPGYLWAAHFQRTSGGERFQKKVVDQLIHTDDSSVPPGGEFLILGGAVSTKPFFDPAPDTRERLKDPTTREMIGRRIGAYACKLTEEARVDGPDVAQRGPGITPGPAIQMGNFNVSRPENEEDVGAWYAQYRLPFMARMPGCVGARKLLAASGWAKHAILYEFVSLEAREQNFIPHEELAHDEKEWTGRVIRHLIHAPFSPFVGRRIWPPA